MTNLLFWLPLDAVRDLGWTLIHFLWQGLILAALLYVILPMCRSATVRHNWALATLGLMAVAPLLTFLLVHTQRIDRASTLVATGTFLPGSSVGFGMFAPASIPMPWIDWLVALWFIGICILSVRALGGWYLAEGLRRRDTFLLPADLLQRCRTLKQRLAITWPVQFLLSNRVSVPTVIGWFRPVVLIPISAVTGLSPQQLDSLILHELAHIQRFDAFINILLIAVETTLFYHPAVWWVSRRVRVEREHCCDDIAVDRCGDAMIYVEALTSLEAGRRVPATALAASGGKLKDRVARLLGVPSDARRSSLSAIAGLAFLSVAIGTVMIAQTNAQSNIQHFAIRVVDESVAKDALRGPVGDDYVSLKGMRGGLWLKREGQIAGEVLAEAHVSMRQDGQPAIQFNLTPDARDQFAAMTRENIGHPLAIVVNDTVITSPIVREPMLSGRGQITGNFKTEAEANALLAEMTGTKQMIKQ